MPFSQMRRLALLLPAVALIGVPPAVAEGNAHKVKHIIIVMQENHSFDNYFGALSYAPNSPYHSPRGDGDQDRDDLGGCRKDDHRCVDGLSCVKDHTGLLTCFNSNIDDDGHTVLAFHDSPRCTVPDLD